MPEPSERGGPVRWLRRFFRWLGRLLFGWLSRDGGKRETPEQAPQPSPLQPRSSAESFTLVEDDLWKREGKFPLDPRLRVVLAQLESGNAAQIKERTGIDVTPGRDKTPSLGVFVELNVPLTGALREDLDTRLGLFIAHAYVQDGKTDPSQHVFPGSLKVAMRDVVIDVTRTRDRISEIVADKRVARLELAPLATASLVPCRGETLNDLNLPADRMIAHSSGARKATGKGVVIGIVDDGCALASWNFLSAKNRSRIRYIFDQSKPVPTDPRARRGWSPPAYQTDYGYGRELINPAGTGPIDVALAANTNGSDLIDEDAVYQALDFPAPNAASHGTHVMDIAAGNGKGLSGREGVAPEAELIFVQLPPSAVEEGGAGLFKYIADGADYVFKRAKDLEAQLGHAVPAVVNISFANHLGAHDGTTLAEIRLEDMLKFDNRAIVLAAGNGFASACHASGRLTNRNPVSLHWLVSGGDESVNSMEIWYTKTADVEFYITPPGSTELGPVLAGSPRRGIKDPAGNVIAYVDHVGPTAAANGDSQIMVTINGTLAFRGSAPVAPAGTWTIRLVKPNAGAPNEYHAWIEHDEARRGRVMHPRQSRFADGEVDPTSTISGSACGTLTIAAGAYNTATNEVAEYSACGPTRRATNSHPAREKPELCAPAASDARGRGALSAATRFQIPTRMGGTSAAAPHVTGLAALVFELNRDIHNTPMPARKLRDLLEKGAKQAPRNLSPNAHQKADANQPVKQSDSAVWPHLVGWGRADAHETLKKV